MSNVLNLKTENDSGREEIDAAERRKAILAQTEAMEVDEGARQAELVRKNRERNQKRDANPPQEDEGEEQNEVRETSQTPSTQKRLPPPAVPQKELSFGTVFLMIGTALLFDTLQALSALIIFDLGAIGAMITFFAFMTFWFWFRTKGIRFNKPSRIITFGGATVVEMVPFLNALPAWTLAVVILVVLTNGQKYAKFVPLAEKALETYKKVQKGGRE